MTEPQVSVIIVSRNRPDDLKRCLTALRFQYFHNFELIVVCDAQSAELIADFTPGTFKTVRFNEANISAARNRGIEAASGTLIAFIDDDAVAEPTWLSRLIEPFSDVSVGAAGGFVRGRNGISYQWKAEHIDDLGLPAPFEIDGRYVSRPAQDRPVKTQGTNAMFRRSVLDQMNGFDENYIFYMDETDLNWRIWQAGIATAILPDAQVHHLFSASAYRRKDRAPLSLFEIGASYAYFCKKHDIPQPQQFETEQHKRLIKLMLRGDIEPRDVTKLRAQLTAGFEDGRKRPPRPAQLRQSGSAFRKFQRSKCITSHKSLSCSWFRRRAGHEKAADRVSGGGPVTLFVLSITTLFHRRWFHELGYWVQSGGIFGKSDREDKLFNVYSRSARIRRELDEIQKCRSQ